MRILLLLFVSFFGFSSLRAQQQTPDLPVNRVVVIGDATLELPADEVKVTVTLQFSDPNDARRAYESHRNAEKRLVQLLREFRIVEKDIRYSLLTVQKSENIFGPEGKRRDEIVTNQQVFFKLNDLKRYPDLQLALIGSGFNRFSAAFSSSKAEESKNDALDKAVEVARRKAVVMAKAAGRTLGSVLSVRDTEETDPVLRKVFYANEMAANAEMRVGYGMAADGNLFDIPQLIRIPAQVKVTFELR
ncbi:SIMPL domain-containing protein [Larkinella soli]|uniref:SIMPL domain-containing protein n=1 Tax=Larkinella soli TaxID=1770527 RepID=UPI000FFC765C|nr:SIMPL domain-containing protein [Larkinella soli]